jgi:hypothetical protein
MQFHHFMIIITIAVFSVSDDDHNSVSVDGHQGRNDGVAIVRRYTKDLCMSACIILCADHSDWHSICTNYSSTEDKDLQVTSPGYPHFYPSDTECRCVIKAHQKAKVISSL